MRWERLEAVTNWGMHTIDTSLLDPRDVADAVLDWCRRALSGVAPIIRIDSAPVG
jgi:hypothetical protein